MDFIDLPVVPPDLRGKEGRPLYVNKPVTSADLRLATDRGWLVCDVRLIAESAARVQAMFEGASLGSLVLTDEQAKALDMEAKILGLTKNQDKSNDTRPDWLSENDPDALIASFGRKVSDVPDAPAPANEPKKRGKRPRRKIEVPSD